MLHYRQNLKILTSSEAYSHLSPFLLSSFLSFPVLLPFHLRSSLSQFQNNRSPGAQQITHGTRMHLPTNANDTTKRRFAVRSPFALSLHTHRSVVCLILSVACTLYPNIISVVCLLSLTCSKSVHATIRSHLEIGKSMGKSNN